VIILNNFFRVTFETLHKLFIDQFVLLIGLFIIFK